MKKIIEKHGKTIASLALSITKMNVNTTCLSFVNQPKLPQGSEDLRKK